LLFFLKDKQYLIKSLLSEGVSVKPQKVKRVPGSSGKLHKNEEGEWEWSDDELVPEEQEEASVSVVLLQSLQVMIMFPLSEKIL
jgi:serine/threonine-protein kinase OSR1/STK39